MFEGSEHDQVVFGTYRREGRWSAPLVELLRRLVGPGGTLIDVGAHVGLVCIPVVEATDARALAFEPGPDNHAFLRRNIERHGLADRIETFELALFSESGTRRLALSDDNGGDHQVLGAEPATADRPTIDVRTATLDDIVDPRRLAAPLVLKLDAQGCEARVLAGASRTLACVDHVVAEWWPAGLARLGDHPSVLARALGDFPWGVVLGRGEPERLRPAADVFESLAWIPTDGSDLGFFDVLVSRHPRLPSWAG